MNVVLRKCIDSFIKISFTKFHINLKDKALLSELLSNLRREKTNLSYLGVLRAIKGLSL